MKNKKEKSINTAHYDRNGNLAINGTYEFSGSLVELKKIIEGAIEEYGENTKCRLHTIGKFPHNWNSEIIITNKELKVYEQ